MNKTALPLVFRQEGVTSETAGQYEEHEVARMVAPLLFSFADQDASPTVVARIGSRVHKDGTPQVCYNKLIYIIIVSCIISSHRLKLHIIVWMKVKTESYFKIKLHFYY